MDEASGRLSPPRRSPPRSGLAVLLFTAGVGGMIQSYLAPFYSVLGHRFGVGSVAVSWMVISFTLALVVLTPTLSKLGDVHGHRRALQVAIGLVATGAILVALAPSYPVLLGGLIAQGGVAGLVPSMVGYLRARFTRDVTDRTVGYLIGAVMFGCARAWWIRGCSSGSPARRRGRSGFRRYWLRWHSG